MIFTGPKPIPPLRRCRRIQTQSALLTGIAQRQRFYTTIDKSSGSIGYIHDWNLSVYAHLDAPTSGMFLSNQAWLFTRHTESRRSVAFRVFSNELRIYHFWRESFLYNTLPGPPQQQGNMVWFAEGDIGWRWSVSLPHGAREMVFRNDLCFIGKKDDFYMVVADEDTEDISAGCDEGYYAARGMFKVESLPSNNPVSGADVTVTLTVGLAGEDPVYTASLTSQTNPQGWATFDSPCIERPSPHGNFVFTFTVTNVEHEDLMYSKGQNVADEAVLVLEGEPEPVEFDPDPAEFTSGTPFQTQTGGQWHHAMTAVEAAYGEEEVEYRFLGYEDEEAQEAAHDSGWRNEDNVEGIFPNGMPQVPHQYWASVAGKNTNRYWTVQYRAKESEELSGVSPLKLITNPNLP